MPPASDWPARLKLWGTIAAVVAMMAAAWAGIRWLISRPHHGPVAGYEERVDVVRREYQDFYGKLMSSPGAERLFEDAAREVAAGRYPAGIEWLLEAAKEAPLPVIFNDLGVLIAEAGDRAQAAAAFQEGLARDPKNALLESNAERLGFSLEMTRPVTAEVEPNNSANNANLIPLGREVSAEMAGNNGDTDCFRFIAPPAPRDHIAIEVEVRSLALELGMRMYDREQSLVLNRAPAGPGQRIAEYISPPPNSTWTLELWSAHGTSGDYTVRVSALHAFDSYEPNDNIFAATHIEVGGSIRANIMDADDTDFYSFESPTSGTVTVEVENGSSTLIPALTKFGPDKRNTGFGPDIRTPGQSLRHSMAVEAHQTYYLQVWSQGGTSGEYSLTIR